VSARSRNGSSGSELSARGSAGTAPGQPADSRRVRAGRSASEHAPARDNAPDRSGVLGDVRVLGRERVGELQRARILAAMTELVGERGVGPVTVAHVVGRSGVSRRTFYELFEDREGCLLAAFDHAIECAAAVVRPAYAAAGGVWEEQVRAALAALLDFLAREPALGHLCVVDALAAERPVLERRAHIVDVLVNAVHRGARVQDRAHPHERADPRDRKGRGPARIVAEGVVGAVLAVIHARLCEPQPKPLTGLLNPLMGIVVLPYLGPVAAERELARPTPRVRRRPAAQSNPLRELDMRLTYRTVRVLLAISEHPAASGRQVADAAGVSDQGQMSKLLWRLEHLGLIHNTASQRGKGEPNAWTLTRRGQDIEQAIRAQTSS
jgi:AcrR family transcriptional regulator/DNA-binding MarR family transcriptional regulator